MISFVSENVHGRLALSRHRLREKHTTTSYQGECGKEYHRMIGEKDEH